MSMRGVKKDGVFDRDDAVHRRLPLAAERADPLPHAAARRALIMAGAAANDLEEGPAFTPRSRADGLVTCVAVDAGSGEVLMLAHMNAEAIEKTLATGVDALLVALAPKAVAQGRHVRPGPDRGRAAGSTATRTRCSPGSRSAATAGPATPAVDRVSTGASKPRPAARGWRRSKACNLSSQRSAADPRRSGSATQATGVLESAAGEA